MKMIMWSHENMSKPLYSPYTPKGVEVTERSPRSAASAERQDGCCVLSQATAWDAWAAAVKMAFGSFFKS